MPAIDKLALSIHNIQHTGRSVESLEKRAIREAEYRARQFLVYAPIYKVDFTLESLTSRGKNNPKDLETLQRVCDGYLVDKPAQAFSARFIDSNGVALFNYLAYRWKPSKVNQNQMISDY